MRLEITDADLIAATIKDSVSARIIRGAAYFLLHTIGDIPDEDTVVPTGTSPTPSAPSVAPAATAAAANGAGASGAGTSTTSPVPPPPTVLGLASNPPPPPPPPTDVSSNGGDDDSDDETGEPNTGNAPTPPPPTAGTAAAPTPSAPTAPGAAAAPAPSGVVSAEFDSAGMPWDERIHQKGKSKKKDNTWKLKKGIDIAIVQAVTAELAARKAAGTAPAPTAGSLPPSGNSVPVPPVPTNAAAPSVPTSNGASAPVPVPPAPAVGGVGASDATPYRKLIDKITDLTKAQKLTPAKVMEICQSHGAPSLMALNGMQHLVPEVDKDIDAAALGLL